MTFVKDANGQVTHLLLHQGGVDQLAKKINYPLAKVESPKEHKAIKLDPKLFDANVGEYQLTSDLIFMFSREGDKFFSQVTGQEKFEIFAENETDFFLKAVDAQVTFVKDAKGHVTQMVLHQGGFDMLANKIK
jgi:serine-type D-Ala-D-Ala carboxypeptidase/endopeptidase